VEGIETILPHGIGMTDLETGTIIGEEGEEEGTGGRCTPETGGMVGETGTIVLLHHLTGMLEIEIIGIQGEIIETEGIMTGSTLATLAIDHHLLSVSRLLCRTVQV